MSEKGSYAHVGLPGLGQLFAYVEGKPLEEEKRDLEADLKVLTIIPKDPRGPVNMVHDVVAPHALRRAIEAERQLTEKDAIIQREYALKHEAYNNITRAHETMADNAEEIANLRKALEIQQNYLMELRDVTPYELYQEQITNVLNESNAALGEGDKE
ncbi:hypothetical protein [Paenibacillus bouchesdurhonensis]|uniref:hypothetical protein n=1 Tax=Paenibacillus bouchesdurhonensis TaxID=1870990 RepID=UPI000DA5F41F|nr:hypothetical protein [Paenibacillus bouchesdurhonensis]